MAAAAIFMPFLLMAYMIPTNALPVVPLMHLPFNKFIFNTVSFIIFIGVICADAFAGKPFQSDSYNDPLKWYIFLWVLGMTSRTIKIAYRRRRRLRCHFRAKSRIYEVFMLLIYWTAFILSVVSWLICLGEGYSDMSQVKRYCKCGLEAEGFYSIGHVLAFGRIVNYFKLFKSLGTLQISIGRMFYDIMRFALVLLIIMCAFGIGIFKMHSLLQDRHQQEFDR